MERRFHVVTNAPCVVGDIVLRHDPVERRVRVRTRACGLSDRRGNGKPVGEAEC